MFKDKFGKITESAKKKIGDAANSKAVSEVKKMAVAYGKEGIVGGVQESLKASAEGKDAGKAFQEHLTNWTKDYKKQQNKKMLNDILNAPAAENTEDTESSE